MPPASFCGPRRGASGLDFSAIAFSFLSRKRQFYRRAALAANSADRRLATAAREAAETSFGASPSRPSIHRAVRWASACSASVSTRRLPMVVEHRSEVVAVAALAESPDDRLELGHVNQALFESDFLRAADFEPLAGFERAHEA